MDRMSKAAAARAVPSNTALAKYQAVATGVDTLVLSVKVRMWPELLSRLDRLKAAEQELSREGNREAQPVDSGLSFAGQPLMLLPHGRRSWKFILHNEYVDVQLERGGVARVYGLLRLSAAFLWSRPPDDCIMIAQAWIVDHFSEGAEANTQVSEIHLCRDVAGLDLADEWPDMQPGIVARADGLLPVYQHGRLETVQVGSRKSPISAVLYDKIKEIRHSGKIWMADIWTDHGWDGDSSVWRVEFRARRTFLREAGINTVDDLLEKLGGLWSYFSAEWLRATLDDGSRNRSRWPVTLWWSHVARPFGEFEGGTITREKKRVVDADKLLQQSAGCLLGVAAITECPAPLDVAQLVLERLASIVAESGGGFSDLTAARMARYIGRG